jgi:hypothetical protein
MVHTFVNPNGNENWTNPAFDKGYISAIRQSGDFPLGDNGGDVNASYVDWTQPVKFKRNIADNTNVIAYVNNLEPARLMYSLNYHLRIIGKALVNNANINSMEIEI